METPKPSPASRAGLFLCTTEFEAIDGMLLNMEPAFGSTITSGSATFSASQQPFLNKSLYWRLGRI
jgi:hypothetical protein